MSFANVGFKSRHRYIFVCGVSLPRRCRGFLYTILSFQPKCLSSVALHPQATLSKNYALPQPSVCSSCLPLAVPSSNFPATVVQAPSAQSYSVLLTDFVPVY